MKPETLLAAGKSSNPSNPIPQILTPIKK